MPTRTMYELLAELDEELKNKQIEEGKKGNKVELADYLLTPKDWDMLVEQSEAFRMMVEGTLLDAKGNRIPLTIGGYPVRRDDQIKKSISQYNVYPILSVEQIKKLKPSYPRYYF